MRFALALLALPLAAARVEPVLLSSFPFTGQRGQPFTITIRGNGLKEATAVDAPFPAVVESAETEPSGRNKADLVRIRISAPAELPPGRYPIRLITPGGLSNALAVVIAADPVVPEPEGRHDEPAQAIPATTLPSIFTGRIDQRGESDLYALDVASAGQVLTFECLSGLPAPGAPGGNARGFDPSLVVWEPSGSWFDPKRLNRLAFNDEPLWVLSQPTDAHLVYRFAKPGRYYLRVEAFSGQGGPDYSYQLRIAPGDHPPEPAATESGWQERTSTRRLATTRLNDLAERGGKKPDQKVAETYRTGPDQTTRVALPANLEGTISQPGEVHRASFTLPGPQDLAIEVETPAGAPPLVNPVVRLLDSRNEEVATTILAGRGACTGALTKSIQWKVAVPVREPGDYTVEVRDIVPDLAGPGFRYRVQVRPQVAHLGDIRIDQDHMNLEPGEAKSVRVVFDREEDYRGAVVVAVENLPAGVTAMAGADFEPDKDPPPAKGRRERYSGRTERTVVVFSAAADAPAMTSPVVARMVVRPLVDGKPGAVIAHKAVPLMVVSSKPVDKPSAGL
ncbi:MAG: hypothetical protein FJW39_24105 [Acidobacteria bacterium]|nr:hypothetical protein [Acidobacteriota bacterium]